MAAQLYIKTTTTNTLTKHLQNVKKRSRNTFLFTLWFKKKKSTKRKSKITQKKVIKTASFNKRNF